MIMNNVEKDMLEDTAKCLMQSFNKIIEDFFNECLNELGLLNGENKEEFIKRKKIKIISYRKNLENIFEISCKKQNYKKKLTIDFSKLQIL